MNVTKVSGQKPPLNGHNEDESDSTEEELDLDTPAISCNPTQVQESLQSQYRKSPSPEHLPPPPTIASSAKKANVSSFRIGGERRGTSPSSSPSLGIPDEEASSDDILTTKEAAPPSLKQADVASKLKKSKKLFRIGGKGRSSKDGASQRATTISPSKIPMRATQSPTAEPPSSPLPHSVTREMTPAEEEVEETPEEKAERRRAELKRRNEEAAKKQAQQKKKKRF